MIGFSEIILAIFVALFLNNKEDWKYYYQKIFLFKEKISQYHNDFLSELKVIEEVDSEVKKIAGDDGKEYESYNLDFIKNSSGGKEKER